MAHDIERILKTLNETKKLPPVESWQPEIVGEIDIAINESMQWFHEGVLFQRQGLVQLLASILRKEGENYYLVTPAEKMKISVSDVPFEIVHMHIDKDASIIHLISNTEDVIHLHNQNQWQLRPYQHTTIPYIHIRNGLWARVSRAVYYQMAELATDNEQDKIGIHSANTFFALEL